MKQHALTHKNQGMSKDSPNSRSSSNPNSDCDQPKTPNPIFGLAQPHNRGGLLDQDGDSSNDRTINRYWSIRSNDHPLMVLILSHCQKDYCNMVLVVSKNDTLL